MSKFQELQTRHLELVARYEQDKSSKALLADIQIFVEDAKRASKEISDSRERNQLRANLRFWGAFIYEHTGTYPNLNLLPSQEGTPAPGPKPKVAKSKWIVIALAALIILIGFFSIVLYPFNRPIPTTGGPTGTFVIPNAGDNPTSTVVIPNTGSNLTRSAEAIATGTATIIQTTNPVTATIGAALTQIAFPTPTITPTTSILLPATGGGDDVQIPNHAYSSIEIQNDIDCTSQRINIEMSHGFSSDQTIEPATLTISEEGTFRTIAESQIPLQASDSQGNDNAKLDTEINIPDAKGSYLVYIDHPKFTFDAVIVQHLPDCHGNLTNITYDLPLEDYDALESRPSLGVKFNLVTWGPYPAIDPASPNGSGVAKIHISNRDNADDYIYWIWSATSTDGYERLQGSDFISSSSTAYYFFITSGGQTVPIPFRIEAPYVGYLPSQ